MSEDLDDYREALQRFTAWYFEEVPDWACSWDAKWVPKSWSSVTGQYEFVVVDNPVDQLKSTLADSWVSSAVDC